MACFSPCSSRADQLQCPRRPVLIVSHDRGALPIHDTSIGLERLQNVCNSNTSPKWPNWSSNWTNSIRPWVNWIIDTEIFCADNHRTAKLFPRLRILIATDTTLILSFKVGNAPQPDLSDVLRGLRRAWKARRIERSGAILHQPVAESLIDDLWKR